jgi:phosphoglycolate phosphatase
MAAFFFDLDGTLVDSRPGLFPSFRAAVAALGLPALSDAELGRFLGTPLPEMFRTLRPGIGEAEIEAAIAAFRTAYEHDGIERDHPYPGALELLDAVRRRRGTSWIVTSKPEPYAMRIAVRLGFDRHVSGVVGAGLDETDTKTSLIARALGAAKVTGADAVMLGDRHYDVEGALANQVLPVGALWGYGSHEELYNAGCRHFARSPDEFRVLFVESAIEPRGTPLATQHRTA